MATVTQASLPSSYRPLPPPGTRPVPTPSFVTTDEETLPKIIKFLDLNNSSTKEIHIKTISEMVQEKWASFKAQSSGKKLKSIGKVVVGIPLAVVVGIPLAAGALAAGLVALVLIGVATPITKSVNAYKMWKLKEKVEAQKLEILRSALKLKMNGQGGHALYAQFNECQESLQKVTEPDYLKEIDLRGNSKKLGRRPELTPAQKDLIKKFISDVGEIVSDLQQGLDTGKIRKKIDRILGSAVYQKLKNTENPAVEFLQILCMKYIGGKPPVDEQGETPDLFANYGHELIGEQSKDSFDLGELSDLIKGQIHGDWRKGQLSAYTALQRNGKISTAIWAVHHPLDTWHAFKATREQPLAFNSHRGNADVYGYDFVLPENFFPGTRQKKTLRFYYGPGPTGDRLFQEGYLVGMAKDKLLGINKPRLFETRVNFQSRHHKPHEFIRGCEMVRMQKAWEVDEADTQKPSPLRLMALAFDTPLMKDPPLLEDGTISINDFLPNLKSHYLDGYRQMQANEEEDNGVFISHNSLTTQQVENALETGNTIFRTLYQDNPYAKELMSKKNGNKRLGRAIVLGHHGVLGVARIFKALKDAPQATVDRYFDERLNADLDADLAVCRASGACKQDIDRGPVENIIERIFFKLATSEEGTITQKELYSIIGAVARAYMVEGRLIQWKRGEILCDLLKLIGSEDNAKKIGTALKEFAKTSF